MLLGILSGVPFPVSAHSWGSFYVVGDWADARLPTIDFKATDDVPSGPARERLAEAQVEWLSVDGAMTSFNFVYNASIANGVDWGECPSSTEGFEGYVDKEGFGSEGPLAAMSWCRNPSESIRMFMTAYNSSLPTWYYGTGDPPNGDHDYWAVLTHELGHATGWYTHYIDTTDTPPGYPETFCDKTVSNYHTMCKYYWPSNSHYPNRGEWMRTLQAHDVDVFESKY